MLLLSDTMLLFLLLAFGVMGGVSSEAQFALPDDLLVGAGVAAIQTEGAWNEGGEYPRHTVKQKLGLSRVAG